MGPSGRVGAEDLIEDGLKEEGAKGVKDAHHGQEKDSGEPLEPERRAVAQEAQEVSSCQPACLVGTKSRGEPRALGAKLHPRIVSGRLPAPWDSGSLTG